MINEKIAHALNVDVTQVDAAVLLLDGGASVPFIARYRKEATGGLDDAQLRQLEETLLYLRELAERKTVILKSITDQNKLTPELAQAISQADTKALLEDLYLPYKPKRRTKAQIAKEAGLTPLASALLIEQQRSALMLAAAYLKPDHNIHTPEDALEGARHILLEMFSEEASLLQTLREFTWQHALLKSIVRKGKEAEGIKFSDYFDYQELIQTIPSHRALALFRGQRDDFLNLELVLNELDIAHLHATIAMQFGINQTLSTYEWLEETLSLAWRVKFFIKLELELFNRLRERAEEEAIIVFSNNLKNLLMAAPAGSRVTMGLDPGIRTGVKTVIVDGTGKLVHHTVVFPHQPRNEWQASINTLATLCKEYQVDLISIGNGTGSRETDQLVTDLKKQHPTLSLTSIVVSEAGASVYSASEIASKEFPDLDVSYRGAISIAKRLQDPLAELVKIDPKSIGVGQYQHDVNQVKLSRSLHATMEDCVNAVGVDANTASAPLLTCVAGLNESVAERIVQFRNINGPFKNRHELKKVPRLGEKAFEQAAGFLRVVNGDNPLDASAVHPEAYPVVATILEKNNTSIKTLMGNLQVLSTLRPQDYVNDQFGLPTIKDIFKELEKPGRDPRPAFKTAQFSDTIKSIGDLKSGLVLEGVITNVTNFGAFVDIGVHQDGLVHISMLAKQFVKDPHQIVKVGDIVTVKVIDVDTSRKRIQLTMRLDDAGSEQSLKSSSAKPLIKNKSNDMLQNTLGQVLMDAFKRK